jgi:hypothetical protein
MNKIKELEKLELHDANVLQLNIDLSNKTITISFEILNQHKSLIFQNFENLKYSGIESINELEINTVNFKYLDGIYDGEFIFLIGFGLPSVTLSFKFMDFEIIDLK